MKTSTLLGGLLAGCLCASSFAGAIAIDTKLIMGGLNYPVWVGAAPGDTSRLFVIEKQGKVRIIDMSGAAPALLPTAFLDVDALASGTTSSEQGLLGMAFHPNYSSNGFFFVNYTNTAGHTVIARYQVSATNANLANAASALIVMTISQPYSNHNGGCIQFGPDGYLYIGMGDGGSANDPGNRAQTIVAQKLGKILRIAPNVAGTSPTYTNPSTNPFYGAITGDDEIWHYGIRNPWRFSFDRQTGDMWIGDVGQDAVEEIDFIAAGVGGKNCGWRCTEGTSCTGLTGCTCGSAALTPPIRTHTHSAGTNGGYCITGGHIYRGCAMPEMQGVYFYADYASSNIWSMKYAGGVVTEHQNRNAELATAVGGQIVNQISSFGEDANGEIYIVDLGSATAGQLFKIIRASGDVPCVPPNPYDLNDDGAVNGADLSVLLAAWGTGGATDFDGNGITDGADLAAFLSNFTG